MPELNFVIIIAGMDTIYLVFLFIFWLAMPLMLATKPKLSSSSMFELERQASNKDRGAIKDLLRVKSFDTINSIIRLKILVIQVILTCLGISYFGWVLGIVLTLILTLLSSLISNFKFIKLSADKIYNMVENPLLNFIKKHHRLVKIFGSSDAISKAHNLQIKSREELLQLIDKSGGALSLDEKKLITNSLTFKERDIKTIMTPRHLIKTVDRTEFLGPMVLNELHEYGHSHLPVINGDLDHIIGILNISSLLSLDNKKSTTAEKAMDKKVYQIKENTNLPKALSVFLRTQNRLLVVVNEAKETIGVVVLKDIIEALVGRRGDDITEI
jgi:CBS domain containing-hemolysin-like protein